MEPWEKFKWDKGVWGIRTWVKHSSQALLIDVFGSIKASDDKDTIMNAISEYLDLPCLGEWFIEMEWSDPLNLLNEKRRTQVDCIAKNDLSVIFFEGKFTERDGGSCSRPLLKPNPYLYGKRQAHCNGNYDFQHDPVKHPLFDYYTVPVIDAKCALTREGIRYWDYIPELFCFNNDNVYRPCPFKGPSYQFMRNLVLAWNIALNEKLFPSLVVVYAFAPGLPMSERVIARSWCEFISRVRGERILFTDISYQEIIDIAIFAVAEAGGNVDVWIDLQKWVQRKIEYACLRR